VTDGEKLEHYLEKFAREFNKTASTSLKISGLLRDNPGVGVSHSSMHDFVSTMRNVRHVIDQVHRTLMKHDAWYRLLVEMDAATQRRNSEVTKNDKIAVIDGGKGDE
jgi:hypothetical protein